MTRHGLSKHLQLEVEAVHHRGGPLLRDEPVPGCDCVVCETLAAGGTWSDVDEVEAVVAKLATLPPAHRVSAARAWAQETPGSALGPVLPAPGVLAALAARVPGAVRHAPIRRRRKREPLDVDGARRVPMLDVVARLGLGEPVRRGREWYVLCPFHGDHHPSLRINPAKNAWYCDVCSVGGDAIELLSRAQDFDFTQAVRQLAGR